MAYWTHRLGGLERTALVLVLLSLPSLATAHPAGMYAGGLLLGLLHPLTGLDHLVAMVTVGLWAAQRGGWSVWRLPSVFVSVMAVGVGLGAAGVTIAVTEAGILASVLVLGLLVAAAARWPAGVARAVVGGFVLFHGLAHGAEMPETLPGLEYGLGILASTAALLGAGVLLGLMAKAAARSETIRLAGGAVAGLGLYLWLT